jgi:site-specific DNA recombinase
MKPWLIYTRVSTDDQVQGASLDVQRTQCEAMAKATGAAVADVVVDDGYSGKDTKRPGMRRVLDMVERRELGGIIVWKLDRLTRNLRDLLAMVDLFTTTDTALVSLAEKIDTSGPMGRFTLHIMGAVAQLERETIQARVTAAMRHIRAKGGWAGGRVPLGCRIVGERGARRLEPDPVKAPAVVGAFQAYVDGISLAQLATRLHEAGVTPRRRNPTNVQGNLHDRRLVEIGVIDAALFAAVAAVGGQRSVVRPRRQQTDRVWPLRGLAYCGRCGAALIGSSGNGRSGRCHYLRCSQANKGSGCSLPMLPAGAWEGAVVEAVAQAAKDQAWADAWAGFAEDRVRRYAPVDARRRELEAKRGQVQARVDRLLDLLAEGTDSPATRARLATMERELSALDAELNAAIGTLAGYDLLRQQRDLMRATINRAAHVLPTAAPEDVNDVLQGVVSRVVLNNEPAAIELVLYVPAPPEGGRRFAQASRLVQRTAHRASEGPRFRWLVTVGRVGPRLVVRLGNPLAAMEAAQRALAAGRSEDLAGRLGVSRRQAQRLMAGRATPGAMVAVADRLTRASPPGGR